MKIALFGKYLSLSHFRQVEGLFSKLNYLNAEVLIYSPFLDELKKTDIADLETYPLFHDHKSLHSDTDFLISLGGDGTFLNTITFIRDSNIPILGINTGRLGFLSITGTSEIQETLEALSMGKFQIEKRSLLQLDSSSNLFGKDNYALNEVSLSKRDSSSMITVHTALDGKHLNSYWADGLIISTATGSTAYNLSCGGPILMPGTGCFTLTPIAPHNLNVRPIVIDDSSELTLEIESRAEQSLVSLDSRSALIADKECITIKKANFNISVVTFSNHSFLLSLRNKLNWGLDSRNA